MEDLLHAPIDLSDLEATFTKEEIDGIIADLPNDKSPGPDGFNNEFIKKCWQFTAQDFYDFCDNFHQGNLCTRSINTSYITLIPKVDAATRVNEFRPISLLNSSMKIISKLVEID